MVKRKFEFGLSNGFCTMVGTISGEKKELLCQVTRNMGKLPHYHDKCHILQQCHKIVVTHNNNMDNNKIVCPHCGKNNFKCSWGLTQHLRNAAYCSQAEKEKKNKEDGYFTTPETITFGDNYWQMHHKKLAKRAKQTDDQRLARHKQFKELDKYVSKEFSASGTKLDVEKENYHTAAEYGSDEDDGMDLSTGSNVNFEEIDVNSEDSNNCHIEDVTLPLDNTIKSKFEAYCLRAQNFLEGRYVAAIKLMFILSKTKASLDTYESMMEEFDEPKTGGAAIDCYHDEEGNNVYKYTRKLHHSHKAKLERQLIEFMIGLQDAVKEHIPRVPLQTKHTWCGETFRAHTWFCSAIWRDWVFIDWGDDGGELPSKISSFVDLSELPEDAGIRDDSSLIFK
jgi:hypothetical protein